MLDDDVLARNPLFEGLNEEARRLLRTRAALHHHAPGDVLWRRGSEPRGLHVVLEGEVRVVREAEGRRRVVHVESEGGTLGEIPLFSGVPYPATAIAARRTTCLEFDRAAIGDAIRADPTLALRLLERLAGRVTHLIDRLDRTTSTSVTSRLARYIDARAPGSAPFTLGATQQEVAEELGTVREVIVRELRALREQNIIEPVGRGRYRITNREELKEIMTGL